MKSRINKPVIIVLLAAAFARAASSQTEYSSLEYSLYGLLINSIDVEFRANNKGKKQHYVVLAEVFDSQHKKTEPVNPVLLNKIPARPSYSVVEEHDVKELIAKGEAEYEEERMKKGAARLDMCGESVWKHFYQKYPRSEGYYHFSDITFSSDKMRAYVEVKGKGAAWDSNMSYVLTRRRKGWEVGTVGGGFTVC